MSLSEYSVKAGKMVSANIASMLGIEEPPRAWLPFACQVRREVADGAEWAGGVRNNNPLNLTTADGTIWWPGQTGSWGGGTTEEWHNDFASFGTLEDGAKACAVNYTGGLYPGVLRAFRGGDPLEIAQEIEKSPWDSGHYGFSFADQVRDELGMESDMEPSQEYKDRLQKQLEETVYTPMNEVLRRMEALEKGRPGHKHTLKGEAE